VDAIDQRPHRHPDVFRLCAPAVEVLAQAVAAIGAPDNRLVEEGGQVIRMGIGNQDDIAAASAIAAIRSPLRDKFLAQEGDAAVPAFAGFHVYLDLIDEHLILEKGS
jgi:hypothetical protein